MSYLISVRPAKAAVAALLIIASSATSGCLGMGYGVQTRRILAEEKNLPRDPETGILLGGEAFFLPGDDKTKAALLIHGFGDTPYDMRPVGEYLAQNGITSYAPLLPGHGTSVKDLEKTGWKDWAKTAEEAYLSLRGSYEKVYIVGFSMGGTIALHLAAKYDTEGVVLLAPCIFTIGHDRPIGTENAIEDLSYFVATDYIINNEDDAAFDMSVLEGRAAYTLFPLTSLRSLVEFMKITRAELPYVEEPLVVIQSVYDDTVDISGPEYVMEHAASEDKDIIWLERAKHLITLDTDRDIVLRNTYEFIRNH